MCSMQHLMWNSIELSVSETVQFPVSLQLLLQQFLFVVFLFCSNVFVVSFHGSMEQQLGSDPSRPILVQVAESAYRFALGSVAGGKSHAPLAPCIPSPHHPPTCLRAYLPPALCCPHKKRVREIEDNGPSIAPNLAYKSIIRSPA